MKATVFLGGGRITTALVTGLRLAGYKKPIIVHDHNARKLAAFRRLGVEVEREPGGAVDRARLLVIAVRPPSMEALLKQIGEVRRPLTVVSLAAGIPLSRLRGRLGPGGRWARAMPSPVCRTARGLTGLCFEKRMSRSARGEVKRLFAAVGQVIEIPESRFDAFTVTYSSSHGYHALATLAAAAERCGLDRKTALAAAAHALGDGISAWRESGMSLAELLQEAATPGGIAATVMARIDAGGYRKVVERGLRAGIDRARRNA